MTELRTQVHTTQKRPLAEEFDLQLFSGSEVFQIWGCQSDLISDWLFPMCTYSANTAPTASSVRFYPWLVGQPMHRVMSDWNPRGHPCLVFSFFVSNSVHSKQAVDAKGCRHPWPLLPVITSLCCHVPLYKLPKKVLPISWWTLFSLTTVSKMPWNIWLREAHFKSGM